MKTIFTIKWLSIAIFVLNLQSAIIHPQSHNLYAQNPQLFEHDWYLHDLVIEGTSNIPPINSEIPFVSAEFFEENKIHTSVCDAGSATIDYIGTTEIKIIEFAVTLLGCNVPDYHPLNDNYNGLYFGFWLKHPPSQTLTYEITTEGKIKSLIIRKPNEDYALYKNEVLLSNDNFPYTNFQIYPNPALETLYINNSFHQKVQASVYDINGKLLKTHLIEAGQSQMEVNQLQTGLYFVVFENESGAQVSKKFVKK